MVYIFLNIYTHLYRLETDIKILNILRVTTVEEAEKFEENYQYMCLLYTSFKWNKIIKSYDGFMVGYYLIGLEIMMLTPLSCGIQIK